MNEREIERAKAESIRRDQKLADEITQLREERDRDKASAMVGASKEILASMYGETFNYTNVIILAGYAGLFGVWQMVRVDISATSRQLVGSLLVASVSLFAGYECYKMIRNALHLNALTRALDHVRPEKRMEAWREGLTRDNLREGPVWVYFLIPTILTAFGAAAILLWELVAALFR